MAIVYRDKEYRNLQEQVFKNMNDIAFLLQENGVLNEFGIKVVGQEASALDMPTVDDYKEDNPEWGYGDAFAIGTEEPYELYILTRANGSHPDDYWFNIGEFPAPGPQGPEGPQGEVGPQGPTGNPGANGISPQLGVGNVVVETLEPDQDATVAISESGTINNPIWNFNFGIPRGADGSVTTSLPWGAITGSITNQTDLANALQAKANASSLASYATQVYANNVASNATYQANVYTDSQISALSSVYMTESALSDYLTDNEYAHIDEIPTDTSDLTNNAGFITNTALSGYATQSWVSSNFLSIGTPIGGAAQWGSISGTLSDQTDLMSKFSEYALLSDIPSLSGYATESWVSAQGYLTSVPSEYATISQVSSAISSLDYASVGALSAETVIPDITGLASETYVNNSIAALSSVYAPVGDYATNSALSSAISGVNSTISSLDYLSVGAMSSETYIPRVGGDNDGTYWTAITLGDDTYNIPQGASGDYVPVLVEESEEDPEMPQYRYSGEITNSSSSIVETVTKEEPDQVATNKSTSLELYQDDAYISHSYQELVSKDNPDYDPEDPESSPTIEEVVDLSNELYIGEGTISAYRAVYDAGTQEVVEESVDLFDLATTSALSSAIDGLSSIYQPIGSYASQADIDALSSVYASQSALSSYAELSGGTVLIHQIFTGYNQFNAPTSFYSSVTFKNVSIGGPWGGSLFTIDSGVSTSFYGHVRFSSNATFMKSVAFGGGAIYNGSTINSGFKLDLPSQSGSLALISDIPSVSEYATVSALSSAIDGLSSIYAPLSNYASTSYVDNSISALSSVYAPVGGYAELSASNTFTGINTFEVSTYASVIYTPDIAVGWNGIASANIVWNGGLELKVVDSSPVILKNNTYSVNSFETWTFTLSDNTTVSKTVLVG